jgi:hypothetical protein
VSAATEKLDELVGHMWCSPPLWTWRVPLRHGLGDDKGAERSLGDALSISLNWLVTLADRRAHDAKEVPVTVDWLRVNGMAGTIDEIIEGVAS